jgi:hypothetical protein
MNATPKFGQTVINHWASDSNPRRVGMFVRQGAWIGRMNRGTYWELTDGRGDFWEQRTGGAARLEVIPVGDPRALPVPGARA